MKPFLTHYMVQMGKKLKPLKNCLVKIWYFKRYFLFQAYTFSRPAQKASKKIDRILFQNPFFIFPIWIFTFSTYFASFLVENVRCLHSVADQKRMNIVRADAFKQEWGEIIPAQQWKHSWRVWVWSMIIVRISD